MVDELILTKLIESLLEWQEKKHNDIFKYDQMDFRGAFARYYYFKSVNDLSKLLPLVKASKGWEFNNKNKSLLDLYKQIKLTSGWRSYAKKNAYYLISLIKVSHIKIASLKSKKPHAKMQSKKAIGFFAFNARFVFFFEELINRFEGYQAFIFSHNINTIRKDVFKVDALPQKLSISSVDCSGSCIPISIFHPLFSAYINLLYFYLGMKSSLNDSQVSALVFAEGTSHYDQLASQAAKSLKIATIRVQSGRGGILHSGYRNMLFNKMLCWGKGFVEHYQKHSPIPVYEVTGSPLVNELAKFKSDDEEEDSFVGIFTQPINQHITKENYQTLVSLCAELIQQMPTLKVIVRKHPADQLLLFEKLTKKNPKQIKLMSSPDYSLVHVMSKIQCAVSFFSTSLSEAAACGVIPVVFKLDGQPSVFPYPEQYGAAFTVHNISNACTTIYNVMHKPETVKEVRKNMRTFAKLYFDTDIKDPLQKVIESIKKELK